MKVTLLHNGVRVYKGDFTSLVTKNGLVLMVPEGSTGRIRPLTYPSVREAFRVAFSVSQGKLPEGAILSMADCPAYREHPAFADISSYTGA